MDTFTQLALMAKAKRVFERHADVFLSFPALSPRTYTPEQLRFGTPGAMTTQMLADASEFARLTNIIPRGVIAPDDEGEYLWDIYRDVLRTAELAADDLSPVERERYERAIALLYRTSPDGLPTPSDAFVAYQRCRDDWFRAQEKFAHERTSAEASDDPAKHVAWRTREPLLREEISTLEDRLLAEGRCAEIERALQAEQTCAGRAPSLDWHAWNRSFMADLDTQTDTSLINFAPTSFAPSDFFEDEDWPEFTLDRGEMGRLVERAPSELVQVLASSEGAGHVQRISFEYRSVAVTRPWFRPAVFKARTWRLPSHHERLSDGGNPAQGRCPAYIAAVVFARKLNIEFRPLDTGPATVPARPAEPKLLDPAILRHIAAHGPPVIPRPGMRPLRRGSVRISAPEYKERRPVVPLLIAPAAPPAMPVVRLFAGVVVPPAAAPAPAPPASPSPGAASAASSSAARPWGSELTVLAFICKRLPRCPDPLPDLTWR
jgi:hypothetical protein